MPNNWHKLACRSYTYSAERVLEEEYFKSMKGQKKSYQHSRQHGRPFLKNKITYATGGADF
jgi:hypothetical protein